MKHGWEKKELGAVSAINYGYTESASNEPIGPRFLRITDIQNDQVNWDSVPYCKINSPDLPKFRLATGDIVFARTGATTGKSFLVAEPPESVFASYLIRLRLHDKNLLPEFVSLFFQTAGYWKSIQEGVAGSAQGGFNASKLAALKIPIPPITDQQRIVGVINEAFDGIATAKANAEKNIQNARALFESHLQSVFDLRGEGWERVTLETLLERGWILSHLDGNHGGDYPRKEEFINEGVPYISANCIDDEQVDMSCAKYLAPERAALLRKGIAQDRDVLFAHNATVGPVAILRTEEEKVILSTSLTYYRCNQEYILPEYLAHYMRSFGFKSQYEQIMRQSTRNQVPITKQRAFFHVIPPLDEQKVIIGQLDGLFESGRQLVTIYQQKLAALDALKKSLLDQAFRGEM
ncbi:MAG: restriction endonuclease subunit S [Desulfuromonadaceae bacterium]|nr:restriction endonuclease subunit S [Desulfuromonadaceae bacterium]